MIVGAMISIIILQCSICEPLPYQEGQMKTMTITVQLEKKDIGKIRDGLLKQALIDIGIWDKEDERNPAENHAAAWILIEKMTCKIGQGIVLHMGVTDALNGYGKLENWGAAYQEYNETCRHCKTHPKHPGNHSWRREWKRKFSAEGFSVESAICRLALYYALRD